MTLDEMYYTLTEVEGINEEVVDTITGIYGFNGEVLTDILEYYTGYHDFETYIKDLG